MRLVTADKVDIKTYNLTSHQGPFINLGNALPGGRFFCNCPLGAFLKLLLKQLVPATNRDKNLLRSSWSVPRRWLHAGVLPVPLAPDCSQGKPGLDRDNFTGRCSLAAGAETGLGAELRWGLRCPNSPGCVLRADGERLEDINSWGAPRAGPPPGCHDNPHSPRVPPASWTRYRSQETNCSPCQFSI